MVFSMFKTVTLVSSLLAALGVANAELETVKLTHPYGSSAEVYHFGAHVKSFHPAMDPKLDVLFMSKKSFLDGVNPIRGGIPVVFPNFGSAQGFPSHGFARITNWTLASHMDSTDEKKPSVAKFTMAASDSTRKMWPVEFELEYEVKLLGNELETALHVRNTNKEPIEFHALLHNYLWVDDATNKGVQVSGLKGVEYYDKVAKVNATETREYIDFASQTDNVYSNAPNTLHAVIKGVNAVDRTTDAVVWNPWADRAKTMEDFGAEEYKNMVAVEPGRVSVKQALPAGQTYTLQETISVTTL
ncbi:Aldose 1-epimerase [Phytophthora cinnamomi]|uniref:Aldose 1-epimerase n=1 Tax=Phytophthora cinnamomi TaxID=4785 RepID=UPI0035597942|nr:Aldose 1-epimerase [Phytophthora cinnamomi]